jgi:hypothetical protein
MFETARELGCYPPERIQGFADLAGRFVQRVVVRGV